jgi:hypothetical protein
MVDIFSIVVRFAKEIITFICNGSYINLSHIDPAILFLCNAGSSSGSTYFTDEIGSLFMCLTAGRCVKSRLHELQPAPTKSSNEQNYWKYIDVSSHTVEFECLCAAVGMASHLSVVDTNLIGGNALRFMTHSGKNSESSPFIAVLVIEMLFQIVMDRSPVCSSTGQVLTRVLLLSQVLPLDWVGAFCGALVLLIRVCKGLSMNVSTPIHRNPSSCF